MVQNGSICVQNYTSYENSQNSPKQSWANYLIFKYIQTFWTNIFILQNIHVFFCGKFIWIFVCDSFYYAKYIRTFIRPLSMVTVIFGYSFVQKKDICPTLDHYKPRKLNIGYQPVFITKKSKNLTD